MKRKKCYFGKCRKAKDRVFPWYNTYWHKAIPFTWTESGPSNRADEFFKEWANGIKQQQMVYGVECKFSDLLKQHYIKTYRQLPKQYDILQLSRFFVSCLFNSLPRTGDVVNSLKLLKTKRYNDEFMKEVRKQFTQALGGLGINVSVSRAQGVGDIFKSKNLNLVAFPDVWKSLDTEFDTVQIDWESIPIAEHVFPGKIKPEKDMIIQTHSSKDIGQLIGHGRIFDKNNPPPVILIDPFKPDEPDRNRRIYPRDFIEKINDAIVNAQIKIPYELHDYQQKALFSIRSQTKTDEEDKT